MILVPKKEIKEGRAKRTKTLTGSPVAQGATTAARFHVLCLRSSRSANAAAFRCRRVIHP
jgi:hypothetical protein